MKNSCSLLFSSILFLSILGITEKPIYAYTETVTSHFFAEHLISTDEGCAEAMKKALLDKLEDALLEVESEVANQLIEELMDHLKNKKIDNVGDLKEVVQDEIDKMLKRKEVKLKKNNESRKGPATNKELHKLLKDLKKSLLDMDGREQADKISDSMDDRVDDETSVICKELIEALRKKILKHGCDHPYDSDKVKEKARESMREEIDRLKKSYPNSDCIKKLKEIRKELTSLTIISAARPMDIIVSATGTGRTTGHIADLSITNNNNVSLYLQAQNFYIPSTTHDNSRHQGYFGRIPDDIVIPPKTTSTVPVEGYCTDVTKPPVPLGGVMPDVAEWIPVIPTDAIPLDGNYPGIPVGTDENTLVPVNLVPGPSVPEFTPRDINDIMTSPEFIPTDTPEGHPMMTWPGTDTPISGRFNHETAGRKFASVVGTVVKNVTEVVPEVQENPDYVTPFSTDSLKEAESITQQVIWIFTSGGTYGKDDFSERLYAQYTTATGKNEDEVTEEEEEKLDQGIDEFWNTFTAVGIEAKVLKNEDENGNVQLISTRENCNCDTLTFTLSKEFGGRFIKIEDYTSTTFALSGSEKSSEKDTISKEDFKAFKLKVENVKIKCSCGDDPCSYYNDSSCDDDDKDKFFFKARVETGNAKDKSTDSNSFEWTVEPTGRFKNVFVYFTIKAYCQSDDCKKETCSRVFRREFVIEDDEN